MSDLPRFYQGSLGRLGFEDLNEIMRRLDALRPLVESASIEGDRPFEIRSLVFPVKAKRLEGSEARYSWNEVVIDTDDRPKTEDDEDFEGILEAFDVSFRSGGQPPEDKEDDVDDYAVLLDSFETGFEEGLAICFAIRRVDKATRYVLVPLESDAKPSLFMVSGGGSTQSVQLAKETSVMAVKYSGKAFRSIGDGWEEVGEAELFDFSVNVLNEPISNTGATYEYHTLESGTIITPTFATASKAYLGTLPRLDFECK